MSRIPKHKDRRPVVIPQEVDIQANRDHVVIVLALGESTIGLRFTSPEHMLTFFVSMMQAAAKVWPDNELIKDYLSSE